MECLINAAINKSGEVTSGVTKPPSKAMLLACLHANRLVEKPPVRRHTELSNREAGWEKVFNRKQGITMGWLVDYFIQSTDIF